MKAVSFLHPMICEAVLLWILSFYCKIMVVPKIFILWVCLKLWQSSKPFWLHFDEHQICSRIKFLQSSLLFSFFCNCSPSFSHPTCWLVLYWKGGLDKWCWISMFSILFKFKIWSLACFLECFGSALQTRVKHFRCIFVLLFWKPLLPLCFC